MVGVWLAHWHLHRPITYPPGILIASDPTQVNLPSNEPEFGFGDFHLKPLARFAIDARLLHSKIYRYDRGASLVPIDLAVGWGPMSDQQVLDHLQVSQSMRFFGTNTKCLLQSRQNKSSITPPIFTLFRRRPSWRLAANLCVLERSFILVVNWSRQPVGKSERGAVH